MKGRHYPQLNLSFAKEDKARLAEIAARYHLRPTELAALVLLEWISAQEAAGPAKPISFLGPVVTSHPEPLSPAKAPSSERKRIRHA